jgi:pimeloyl-ACP methyl ester carboxylesterase
VKIPGFLLVILLLGLIPAAAQEIPNFESTPCPIRFPSGYNVECGFLTVPEEHNNPEGARIRLMVAIFRASANRRQPDPIIYLSGGPGVRTLDSFAPGLGTFLNNQLIDRDVILIDQRGMGYSEPSLDCPEVDALSMRAEQGPYTDDLAAGEVPVRNCFERLVGAGVNIAAYNTVESAADIASIAPALGYEQVNIYGGSYGSTLAMTVMRHHPERLRSVVLVGITPPQVDLMASFAPNLERALDLLFRTCADDAACNQAYPDLKATFYETVAQLNAEPLKITVNNPLTGRPTTYTMTGTDFTLGIQLSLYDWPNIPHVPLIIAATHARNSAALEPLIAGVMTLSSGTSEGANYAMRCMDDVMTTTPAVWNAAIDGVNPALQNAFRLSIEYWQGICANWGARQLDVVENTPVTSQIPTLILNGGFDPVTPAKWGALAAETLPNSFNYDFATSAHGPEPSTCAVGIFRSFITNPTREPAADCITALPPIQFTLP